MSLNTDVFAKDRRVRGVAEGTPTVATAIRVIRLASWGLLGLAILASIRLDPGVAVAAAACGGVFVIAAMVVPIERLSADSIVSQLFLLGGSILTVAAATLTGGLDSPYLVLAMMPALVAAMTGGYRAGISTSVLTAGLLAAVTATTSGIESLLNAAGTIGLFPLLALVVAQIRALMLEAVNRASSLEVATAEAEAELVRFGQANDLLRRLIDLYAEGSTNPVEVGRFAIEAIVDSQPGSFATATLFDNQGPVVVARAGTDAPDLVRSQFPLGDDATTSGVVSLGTPEPLSTDARAEIERALRPVAVAFSNAVLLQEIAGAAVIEERLRLARELHDEVGPALAALGFSLDSVGLQATGTPLGGELAEIRTSLGVVVDDLRGIIADLRSDEAGSLTVTLLSAVSKLDGPPEVEVDLHERRPPRSAAGRQLLAILTEAIRNAHRHADAKTITVTGLVDRHEVDIEVIDDGRGFDPAVVPEGHFGVMGMRERADRIGATMDIHSDSSGTRVSLAWKEQR